MRASKSKKPTMCILQKKPWLTWSFAAEYLTKGGLTAIGTLIVYVIVIVVLIQKSDTLRDAVALRLPGLARQ